MDVPFGKLEEEHQFGAFNALLVVGVIAAALLCRVGLKRCGVVWVPASGTSARARNQHAHTLW